MKNLRYLSLSILSGLLFALAWPERGFFPLIFLAFVPLFFIQQELGDRNRKGMFWYAWLAFLIWNALTTWWIWYSTDVGSILAIALNALFVAVIFYVFHLSRKRYSGNKRGLIFLLFYWLTWEYFHMNWDLTWSWLNLGNVFASAPKWVQWYEITGTMGGTAWVILINIMVFLLLKDIFSKVFQVRFYVNAALLVLLFVLPVGYSYYLYHQYDEPADPVEVVVVQPNTDPYTEQYSIPPMELLEKNLELASRKISDSTVFVAFPESTLYEGPGGIWEHQLERSRLIRRLQQFLEEYPQVSIVIGASTYSLSRPGEKLRHGARKFPNQEGYYYAYNTALFMDTSDFIQIHHKSKLTPGVEIMPSWGILKPIEKLAIDLGGMTGSLGRDDYPVAFTNLSNVRVSAIICYESIYGEFVSKTILEGAQLIFIITNDGWWGNTPGHRQHMQYAVLRAIETRRSIARSANTGISAFINQRGDILESTEYWKPDVIAATLNKNDTLTYFVRNGEYIARTAAFLSALIILISFTQGFLRKRKSVAR